MSSLSDETALYLCSIGHLSTQPDNRKPDNTTGADISGNVNRTVYGYFRKS